MVLQPVLMGYSEQTELNISASSTNNLIHTVVTILYGTKYNLCNSSNHKRGMETLPKQSMVKPQCMGIGLLVVLESNMLT